MGWDPSPRAPAGVEAGFAQAAQLRAGGGRGAPLAHTSGAAAAATPVRTTECQSIDATAEAE
jgi:hypothetical protein